jgi:hypothetical protein
MRRSAAILVAVILAAGMAADPATGLAPPAVSFSSAGTSDPDGDQSTYEEHGHPLSSTAGCAGTITTVVDSGHAGASNLSAVFVASYTDTPDDPNVPPLTGSDEVVLVPTHRPSRRWGCSPRVAPPSGGRATGGPRGWR